MKRTKLDDRVLPEYTRGEEIFNMVTHIVGGVFGIAVLVLCIVFGVLRHNNYGIASGIIYGISMILLYTMSSIYHGLSPNTKSKKSVSNYGSLFDFCIDCWYLYTYCVVFDKTSRFILGLDDLCCCLGLYGSRNHFKCN